jgi:hypothetical protein
MISLKPITRCLKGFFILSEFYIFNYLPLLIWYKRIVHDTCLDSLIVFICILLNERFGFRKSKQKRKQ